jgi:alpha-L-fucosidase
VRGNGAIDDKEEAVLDGITAWMRVNGEAIYGTRPWRTFGEGPTRLPVGMLNEGDAKLFTAEDVRFTRKGDALHAFFLESPSGVARIGSLGARSSPGAVFEQVTFQDGRPLRFTRDQDALRIELPLATGLVPRVTIRGRGLA